METKTIVNRITEAFNKGRKLMIAGNGGSAAMSQHIAAEFVGKYKYDRQALPAIALTTDTSILTSIANDFGYDQVFVRQLEALANPGDVFLALSTSGKSKNILKAIEWGKENEMVVIDLIREGKTTAYIQEMQLVMLHEICGLVEENFR